MKASRSQLDWLTFSCSCAKSYITEEPAQHVEVSTWLSCQKLQGKKKLFSHYFTAWAKAMGESQYGRRWRRRTQSRLRKRLLSGYPAVPQQKLCVTRKAASARVSIRAIYPGSRLPGYQRAHSCNMRTCPSNLQHVSYLHSVKPPGCISFFRANQISAKGSTGPWSRGWEGLRTRAPRKSWWDHFCSFLYFISVDVCTISTILPLYCPSADKRDIVEDISIMTSTYEVTG